MHRYKIFLISGETVEVEAESVKIILDESRHCYRHDFVVYNPTYITRPIAIFYTKEITGWAELPETKKSVSIRENLSYIQNMCNNNSTCDGCPFENGNCYFYNVPTKWNIDDIMKMLEIAESEVQDATND